MYTKNCQWTKEDIDILQDNYLSMSNKQLGNLLGRTEKAVQVKMHKLGLKRPDKYYYDKDFFRVIDTEEKAYWLGFMYADGYVQNTKLNAEVAIELTARDTNHLRKFNKSLHGNIEPTIRFRITGNIIAKDGIASFRIYCKSMAKDLISHGCVPNKTFVIEMPELSKELLPHFVRGYFDGDGSMYKDISRNFIGFNFTSGSEKMMQGLQAYLYSQGIYAYFRKETPNKLNFSEVHEQYRLLITGMNNAFNFGQFLYNEATIFLDRKREKYFEALKEYNIIERSHNRPYRR